MRTLKKLCLLTAAVLSMAVAVPTFADEISELEANGVLIYNLLPRASEMVRNPMTSSYEFFGNKKAAKDVSVKELPGGKAVQIKVGGKGKEAWSVGANIPTQLATKDGDVLVAVLYARAKKLPEGVTETTLPIYIQEQGGDYKQFGQHMASVTDEWGRYVVYGELDRDFKKGAIGASVHLATGKQTIELGPIYLMNMGPGAVNASDMPSSVEGRKQKASLEITPQLTSPVAVVPVELARDFAALEGRLPKKPA